MLVGPRGRGRGVLHSPRALLNKGRGFTLIETLVTAFITVLIISALFMALKASELSFPLDVAKINLQSNVRAVMRWIAKDTRQAVSWDIANNAPSPTYIKFRQVEGTNTTDGSYLWSSYHIEYSYDGGSDSITRSIIEGGVTTSSITFSDIWDVPFYTVKPGNIPVPLDASNLTTSRKLIIQLNGHRQVPGPAVRDIFYNMTLGVKIRNE